LQSYTVYPQYRGDLDVPMILKRLARKVFGSTKLIAFPITQRQRVGSNFRGFIGYQLKPLELEKEVS